MISALVLVPVVLDLAMIERFREFCDILLMSIEVLRSIIKKDPRERYMKGALIRHADIIALAGEDVDY